MPFQTVYLGEGLSASGTAARGPQTDLLLSIAAALASWTGFARAITILLNDDLKLKENAICVIWYGMFTTWIFCNKHELRHVLIPFAWKT